MGTHVIDGRTTHCLLHQPVQVGGRRVAAYPVAAYPEADADLLEAVADFAGQTKDPRRSMSPSTRDSTDASDCALTASSVANNLAVSTPLRRDGAAAVLTDTPPELVRSKTATRGTLLVLSLGPQGLRFIGQVP
jgi:hypothetical protein